MDTTTTTNASPSLTPIRLLVRVTRDAAITAATGREGVTPVALTPEVLSALTLEQRALCAELLTPSSARDARGNPFTGCHELRITTSSASVLTIRGATPSDAEVLAALRERLDREAAERDELVRAVDAEGDAAVEPDSGKATGPVEGWYESRVRAWRMRYDSAAEKLSRRAPNHPALQRVRATMQECQERAQAQWVAWYLSHDAATLAADARAHEGSYLDGAMREPLVRTDTTMALWNASSAVHEARKASEKAAAEAESAAKEAARKAAREALAAYALTVPTLAPAAREGYDVADAALGHIAKRVREFVVSASAHQIPIVSDADEGAWSLWSHVEREDGTMHVPTPEMIEAWEDICAEAAAFVAPEGTRVTPSRIGEMDVDGSYPEEDDHAPLGMYVSVSSIAPNTHWRAVLIPLGTADA